MAYKGRKEGLKEGQNIKSYFEEQSMGCYLPNSLPKNIGFLLLSGWGRRRKDKKMRDKKKEVNLISPYQPGTLPS